MRKVIVSNMLTVDGFFEGPDQDLSWFQVDPQFHQQHLKTLFASTDTILLGRKTYDLFSAYWPEKTIQDDEVADFINKTAKIVVSGSLAEAPWGKWPAAKLIKEKLEENVVRLKQEQGQSIIIFGSGEIVSALADADLIDWYRIIIIPVLLGAGKQMISGSYLNRKLNLTEVTSTSDGVTIMDYQRSE